MSTTRTTIRRTNKKNTNKIKSTEYETIKATVGTAFPSDVFEKMTPKLTNTASTSPKTTAKLADRRRCSTSTPPLEGFQRIEPARQQLPGHQPLDGFGSVANRARAFVVHEGNRDHFERTRELFKFNRGCVLFGQQIHHRGALQSLKQHRREVRPPKRRHVAHG